MFNYSCPHFPPITLLCPTHLPHSILPLPLFLSMGLSYMLFDLNYLPHNLAKKAVVNHFFMYTHTHTRRNYYSTLYDFNSVKARWVEDWCSWPNRTQIRERWVEHRVEQACDSRVEEIISREKGGTEGAGPCPFDHTLAEPKRGKEKKKRMITWFWSFEIWYLYSITPMTSILCRSVL